MANKETKRERREAARRARMEAQRRAQRRKTMRRIYGTGVLVVVVAAIVVAVMFTGRQRAALVADLNAAADPAGCTPVQNHPDEGATHVDTPVEYRTNPPTSGDHLGRWERTGVHNLPIQNEVQVHNLEHGHVGVQYIPDQLDEATLDALEDVVRANDEWSFMAPKDDLEHPLAFNAWTRSSTCAVPGAAGDVAEFARLFIETQRDHGRESIPGTPIQ